MKRIYFIRHGETVSNTRKTLQDQNDTLTPEGERQALRVAERATGLTIEHVIISDAVRTRQTASYILEQISCTHEFSPLFREWSVPSSLVGKGENSDEFLAFRSKRESQSTSWKMEDEESFDDRISRVRNAITFLESKEQADILVVTHGNFLKFLMATILLRRDITRDEWRVFSQSFKTTNTGITMCVVEGRQWRMLTWNDHAHFGEGTFAI